MQIIKPLNGNTPKIGTGTWLSENVVIIGDVSIGSQCSIWYNTVIRGDVNTITIGDRVNIQDGTIIHCTYQKTETWIGSLVSIGHNAIIHGCRIENHVLIGMGAIIMDNVRIQKNVIVGAGSVVLENSILESGYLYAGVPAKKIKPLSGKASQSEIDSIARNYIKYKTWYE